MKYHTIFLKMVRIVTYGVALVIALIIILPYLYIYRPGEDISPKERPQINESTIVKNKTFKAAMDADVKTEERYSETDGYYLPCMHYSLDSSPEALAVGDIDNDGKNDVIVSSRAWPFEADESRVHVFFQDESGKLQQPKKYHILQGAFKSIAVGDINGDGKNEFIAVDFNKSLLKVLIMNTSRELAQIQDYNIPEARDVKIADMNRDGLNDVILIKEDSLNTFISAILFQQTDGTLSRNNPIQYSTDIGPGDVINGIAVGYIYSDGNPLFLIAHSNKELATVSISGMPPHIGKMLIPILNKPYQGRVSLASLDVDSDGRSDIIAMYDGLYIYIQERDGSFSPPKLDLNMEPGMVIITDGLSIGDLNGDGRKDIVIAARSLSGYPFGRINVLCRTPEKRIDK